MYGSTQLHPGVPNYINPAKGLRTLHMLGLKEQL